MPGLRYTLQFPFTAQNNSYSTPTVEDVCGLSGVNSSTGNGCNLFQPGVMPGKAIPQFYQLEEGQARLQHRLEQLRAERRHRVDAGAARRVSSAR